jgi:ADP-heptose:LPS heptosyltransferase/glycosyltransferase involved in cell wall biosynthesis
MEAERGMNDYDLCIHVGIPNETQRAGRFHVLVTAAVETDRVSANWVQKCNKECDLIIVPSEHSKYVLARTAVDWQNPNTGERGTFKIEKPIVVCPEGIDTSLFHKKEYKNLIGLELEPDFCFLHVGQWGTGNFGEDRKNIALMLKYFLETFRGRKDVGLVLKTNMSKNHTVDYENCKARVANLKEAVGIPESECPPIYLVHANLTTEEMADLYNHPKIKAFISLTHGEGFGIPIAEAAACGLPILATNWSGHLDILKDGKFIPLDYELKEIPDSVVWEPILIKGSQWACVKEQDAKHKMEKITKSYSKPREWANELAEKVKQRFDLKKTNEEFVEVVKQKLIQEKLADISPDEYLKSLIDDSNAYNILFCMPRSTGDVFIATAVIDGLMKQVPEGANLYFATEPKYFNVLEGNPHIHKLVPYQQFMMNVEPCEEVFDLYLSPDTATQYIFSNFVRKGNGRLLAEEYARYCDVELGDYYIKEDDSVFKTIAALGNYVTIHVGAGKGLWEARNYRDWPEVIHNLKLLFPQIKIAQVGAEDDMQLPKQYVDVDLRGKTTPAQLSSIVKNARLHVGIDSFPVHLAAAMNTPLVAIYGCSYAGSSGPWVKDKEKAKFILLQSERQSGCKDRPCFKNRCKHNPQDGAAPINEIDCKEIFGACARLLIE